MICSMTNISLLDWAELSQRFSFISYLLIFQFINLFVQNSGCTAHEVPDDKALVGFAQLSLIDPSDPEAQLDIH